MADPSTSEREGEPLPSRSKPAGEVSEEAEASLSRARQLLASGSVSEAIELFACALESIIAEYGEHHIKCASVYVDYAKALLVKAQTEGDPFGNGVCQKEAEASGSPSKAKSQAAQDEEDVGDEGEEGEEGEEGDEADEEADDLELSFQCFEVARLIYEKHPGYEMPHAQVLESLGEVQMENEMWTEAIEEFDRSLSIKKKILSSDDRQLAHLYYQKGTASVALMESVLHKPEGERPPDAPSPEEIAKIASMHRKQAREAYEAAAEVLQRKLESIAANGKSAATDEQTELEEVLAEVRSKVLEHAEVQKAKDASVSSDGTAAAFKEEGVTTIGFGASAKAAGVTTIGFAPPDGSGSRDSALTVKNLGVVGGASGKKKAVIQSIDLDTPAPCQAMSPSRKRVKLDVEANIAATSK